MIKKLIITLFATFCCAFSLVMGQAQEKSPQDIQKEKRMEWFSNAKLGIFIHWGIYSVKGVSESWSFSINTCRMRNT